jgi:hypothetical protein
VVSLKGGYIRAWWLMPIIQLLQRWRLGELQFKATRAKSDTPAGCQWLTLIILATQEAEIKRMEV